MCSQQVGAKHSWSGVDLGVDGVGRRYFSPQDSWEGLGEVGHLLLWLLR